ncbi:pirin family protein [Mangrovibacterium lignilyticum]|uniref:pirin family protein n=1 Tax=Mangrovibacterium lignilyticum TaxID=2668052 RepID=UPI0013D6AAAB|nr:pirin family protein [Mangrovibacterium lignilyticum]
MRTIKTIHKPVYEPIADLVTYRVIPTSSISYLDPFLFLNHHGPQVYQPNNNGLPFGPHPHRGMETVTFILDGDIAHYDSDGHKSVIEAGGVQWMTAGRGLIHSEVSSEAFKQTGGPLEILQLWVNLPAKSKMTQPFYKGLQKEDIPRIVSEDGLTTFNLISGEYAGVAGPFDSGIGLHLATIEMKKHADFSLQIPGDENIFFYIIRGKLKVNEREIENKSLVEFENEADSIRIYAMEDSVLLVGHAVPLYEPVVSQGPFVMNTRKEIAQAYEDYRLGKFGTWQH